MNSQRYIKAIVYFAALVWTIVLYITRQQPQPSWLPPLSIAATAALYAALIFDLWLWRLPLLHGWFVKRPVLSGTWHVLIRSNWKDPATGAVIAPVEGYMVVRQTLSTLSMRLITAESSSELVGTEIVCAIDGTYCVSGVYRNEPRFEARAKSPIHYGAVWLKVSQEPTKQLFGQYWTDRQTAGEMELTDQQQKKFGTFQSARDFFATLPAKSSSGGRISGN